MQQFKYVWLDFETTGLDLAKDEIIQIWIVVLDLVNATIIEEFKSYVRPSNNHLDLKSIVGFITGLRIEDLQNAPSFSQIKDQIKKIFDKDTIIIWHNVQFDIDFLKKYIPDIVYHSAIDTFQLSQIFVHYAPSYALQVLSEYLKTKDEKFVDIFNWFHVGSWSEVFHDALYDVKSSLALFVYFAKYVNFLCEKYTDLKYYVEKHEIWKFVALCINPSSPFSQGVKATQIDKLINFPALNRINAKNTALKKIDNSIDIKKLDNLKKYYVGNINFKDLLTRLASNKNIVFAFSNKPKLDIAKNILNEIGIKNIGFAKEEQTINHKVFKSFLNKWMFSQSELNFILKYVSHLEKWYGVLDLNTKSDYQIYYFLKDKRLKVRYPIVLTTHHGFFSMINNNEKYQDYNLWFFDWESWYKSYNFYLWAPCDLYYTLNFVETLIYTYQTRNYIKDWKYNSTLEFLNDFYNFFQIFVGNLFMETKQLFMKIQNDKIQHDPIVWSSNFHKTNLLLPKLWEYKSEFEKYLLEDDFKTMLDHIENIEKVFNWIVWINKNMYESDKFYFVYSLSTNFTSWQEFLDILWSRYSIFFSNTNKEFDYLDSQSELNLTTNYTKIFDPEKVVNFVVDSLSNAEKTQSIFIVSTQKYQSKQLFDMFYEKNIQDKAFLMVENITWWAWKNIFNAKQVKNRIMIWWYQFFLNTISNKINIDICVVFNIMWTNEQGILDDLKYYSS